MKSEGRRGGDERSCLFVGERMREVERLIARAAATDVSLLVCGESGVGKQLLARTIHERSRRARHPFVEVNCRTLPDESLARELLGERTEGLAPAGLGPGKYRLAHQGTLVLDEVAEMPLPMQLKLVQSLQNEACVGTPSVGRVDVRIVALTTRDLRALVDRDVPRRPLLSAQRREHPHPPLRERPEEYPGLVAHFLDRYAKRYGRAPMTVSAETLRRLLAYQWPGNIRELENLVKRIVVLGNEAWAMDEFPVGQNSQGESGATAPGPHVDEAAVARLTSEVEQVGLREITRRAAGEAERVALEAMLERVHWDRGEAARRLKISYTALLNKMKLHALGYRRAPRRRRTSARTEEPVRQPASLTAQVERDDR